MAAAATGVINYWAAAREAAGTRQEPFTSTTLAEALAGAVDRHGAELARVLARCSFVIDGQPVGKRSPAEIRLVDGAVIEVLPPFAGGSEAAASLPATATEAVKAPGLTIAARRDIAMAVALTVAGCALLLLASWAGRAVLAVGVLLLQVLLVLGWFRVANLRTPGQLAGAAVAIAAAMGADISLLNEVDDSSVRPLTVVLAALVVVAFVVQLGRRDGRDRLTDALAGTIGSGALAITTASLLGVRGGASGAAVVAVTLAGVGGALLTLIGALLIPAFPDRSRPVVLSAALSIAFVVGVAVGGLVATAADGVGGGSGTVIAVVAVATSLMGVGLAIVSGHVASLRSIIAALPFAVIGPAVLITARIVIG